MSNPHTPTVAEEVDSIMDDIEEYAGLTEMGTVLEWDRSRGDLRQRLTTLLTRLRAAEEDVVNGLHVPTLKEVARRLLLDATFAHPQGGNEQGLGRAMRMVEGMIERRSTHTRLRQEQDNG